VRTLNDIYLHYELIDIGGGARQQYRVAPDSGRIIAAFAIIDGAIGTGDEDLTIKINGTAVTGGIITMPYDSSAAWDKAECRPTALNDVVAGDTVEVEGDSACSGTVDCAIVVVIRR
jgi:hypothetical protein